MQPPKKRVLFIDAMRGFTMFLVVLGHVFVFGLGYGEKESVLSSFFITFRMPMFFFISGYIGFKAIEKWTFDFYWSNLCKKAQVQLIPTIVFFTLWCCAFGKDLVETFLTTGATVYWFTVVLFEMFVVYFSVAFLSHAISQKLFNPIMICIVFATIYILSFCFRPTQITGILSIRAFCRYFQFFCIGLLCRRYNEKFMSVITRQEIVTGLIVLFVALFVFMWSCPWGKESFFYKANHDLLIRYVGLFLVFALFAKNADFFNRNGRVSQVMQFVGRRTLDIFLIHYFFLPDIHCLRMYFIGNKNILIEFLLSGSLALSILVICLVVSSIVRNSDLLAKYIFGVNSNKIHN